MESRSYSTAVRLISESRDITFIHTMNEDKQRCDGVDHTTAETPTSCPSSAEVTIVLNKTNPATSSSSRAFRTSALLIDLRALPLQPALHAELLDEPLEAAAKILSEVSLIISLQLLCFLEEEEKHSLKHTHTITDY